MSGTNSSISVTGAGLGTPLEQLLTCAAIEPGTVLGYQTAKIIYVYHPLGAKMADGPIKMAQSQKREISIPKSPEDLVREAFENQWRRDGVDNNILSLGSTARIYGVGALVFGAEGISTDVPIDPDRFAKLEMYFNVLDPLNTAGSLVLNQNPNAPDFQKYTNITAAGQKYHRSRAVVLMHERPIYIEYTSAAFGYVGRSVYQRALYPLKSFINSMKADDMVARKCGLIVAKLKAVGSIIDSVMQYMAGIKRALLQQAATDNVLSIDIAEDIQAIDLQNVDKAGESARRHILENIAVSADMPAKLLNQETFAEGFGEGTEDAKNVARYIESIREWLNPVYEFFDNITMYRAWNEDFYKTVQALYPAEYGKMEYKEAFMQWRNSFKAEWPSLLIEPESERVKVDDVKLKAIIAMLEVLIPAADPVNKQRIIEWAANNFNDLKLLFQTPLILDYPELAEFMEAQAQQATEQHEADTQPEPDKEPHEPEPFAKAA